MAFSQSQKTAGNAVIGTRDRVCFGTVPKCGSSRVSRSAGGRTSGQRWCGVRAVEDGATEALPIEKSSTAFEAVKDIDEIMKVLPHRFPFLLVDRVVSVDEGKSIVGYKNITVNDNFFTGHFPERPIMPGVLQVEALAQLGGLLVLSDADEAARSNFFFGGIENCRFRKPVVPGDTLMMKVTITKFNKRFGICKAHGEAFVGEDVVCEADLTLVIGKGN